MANNKRRLMVIKYTSDDESFRLQKLLEADNVPFVAFREYEFVGGGALWKIYIDRKNLSWNDIIKKINSVRPVIFHWENDGSYIKNKTLYTPC